MALAACTETPSRASGSTSVQRDRRLDDLPGTMRVDVHTLPPVPSHHDNIGGETRTFDAKLEAVALGHANGRAPGAAATLSPAAADLVLFVHAELSDEIEIVTVTGTAELQFDVTLAPAARSVSGIATDTLGRAILWP